MKRILTIDDARAIRMMIKKALGKLPYEIFEAEDGEKGLAMVGECNPDLILLDVTMPVLDGPGMLKELRARGNKTPVILLTAESGSSIIGPMLSEGSVLDYVIKPFKAEQLQQKVLSALADGSAPVPGIAAAVGPAAAPQVSAATAGVPAAGKSFVDILVIDDMPNVAKKFRSLLPGHVTFSSCTDRQGALTMCRERVFRAVVIDMEIPDVDSVDLLRDLRVLQPTAAFFGLVMRASKVSTEQVRGSGFSGHLVKPFDAEQVDQFLATCFENLDLLQVTQNVIQVNAYAGSAGAMDSYYRRLADLIVEAIDAVAAACFEEVIVDLERLDPSNKLQKLLVRLNSRAEEMGMTLHVVGSDELGALTKQLVETAGIGVFSTLNEAQSAAG